MDDVAFYDSQVQYQKRIGEIEKERLKLEREMFSMMRSDKKLQNLKAAKLKSLWQQVCEREKRARERDEQLLKDFESMEVELSVIQARTSKLRRMKEEYDVKVKQMYPQWRKEVEIARAKKQLRERGIKMSPRKDNVEPLSHPQRVHNEAPERESRYEASPRMEDPGNMRRPKKPADPVSIQSNKKNVNESVSSHKPVFTSTPVSAVAKPEIVSQGSGPVQPPPESFADVTPQKVVYVNATSPIRSSASEGRNVVHTIPTAQSLQEEPSEVSEPSTFSEQDRVGEKPQQASGTAPAQRPWMMAQTSGDRHLSSEKETLSPTHSGYSQPQYSAKHVARQQSPRRANKPESLPSSSPAKSVDNISPRRHIQTKSPNSTLSSVGQQPKSSDSKMEKAASISSFSSDNMSPRENAPLTANAAYQALLKQHSSAGPAAINIPDAGEESDEDDLENLLSPHEPMEKRSFAANQQVDNSVSGSEENFSDRVESPVYIPTAMSAGSSRSGKEATKVAQTKPPKVPWDTDTEDEDSFEDTSFMATGGSSLRHSNKKAEPLDPEDDFDFYD